VFGAAVNDLPYGRSELPALESVLGRPLGIAAGFVDWNYVIGGSNERWMAKGGARKVLLAWEPDGVRFTDVTRGAQDAYLQKVANAMRVFPYDVYVRPWPEMNGTWSTWQPTASGSKPDGGTPAQFVAAWRYVVTFMRERGATHLKFMFNPDASTYTGTTPVSSIWPGSSYVDVLGIDGYNWGNSATGAIDTGDRWQSFASIFSPMYKKLTALDKKAPVWIAEFGCKEPAEQDDPLFPSESSPVDRTHSKGAWINDMMASKAFPRVKALVYFNKKKERDWRLNSSASSLTAIRTALPHMPTR
jgi:beta-mannanase